MAKLCVNIDHVATVRNARGGVEPDPLHAAVLCEQAGAIGITFHLREDRRHIRDEDAYAFRRIVKGVLNMEMAATDEMVKIALKIKPDQVTLVPEKREELTTEGGLDVVSHATAIEKVTRRLQKAGIAVALFIDARKEQIQASHKVGATVIELHTGTYAELFDRQPKTASEELELLHEGALLAYGEGLVVNAGHGLNYRNVVPVARLPYMNELNIGHALIGRAVMVGLDRATRDMVELLREASSIIEED